MKRKWFGKGSERSENKDIIWISSNNNSVFLSFPLYFILKFKLILNTRQV